MTFARCLRIFLAVALLAAWQHALVHPIQHVDEAGAFVHLADGHEGGERNGLAGDPLCDAVAAVAACVGGAASFAIAFLPGGAAVPAPVPHGHAPAPALAYRSQAPPQFS